MIHVWSLLSRRLCESVTSSFEPRLLPKVTREVGSVSVARSAGSRGFVSAHHPERVEANSPSREAKDIASESSQNLSADLGGLRLVEFTQSDGRSAGATSDWPG